MAALALLADPARATPSGLRSLLTVSNPAYPQGAAGGAQRAQPQGPTVQPMPSVPHFTLPELWGQLPLLPGTAKESESISSFFDPKAVMALRGAQATKKALVAALPGRHVIHIAAHGIANDRFGNLFGALALTPPPPGQETLEDDGFLALHEIYTLRLKECELAVLSACVTNVGPQPPMEAGVTLAGGFLASGARRVLASHWGVDDEATAELMTVFFQKVTDDAKAGRPVRYAQALQQARQQVRNRKAAWSTPYFWAPFVLVGPVD
jgi:CHAT domain-containing protein